MDKYFFLYRGLKEIVFDYKVYVKIEAALIKNSSKGIITLLVPSWRKAKKAHILNRKNMLQIVRSAGAGELKKGNEKKIVDTARGAVERQMPDITPLELAALLYELTVVAIDTLATEILSDPKTLERTYADIDERAKRVAALYMLLGHIKIDALPRPTREQIAKLVNPALESVEAHIDPRQKKRCAISLNPVLISVWEQTLLLS